MHKNHTDHRAIGPNKNQVDPEFQKDQDERVEIRAIIADEIAEVARAVLDNDLKTLKEMANRKD